MILLKVKSPLKSGQFKMMLIIRNVQNTEDFFCNQTYVNSDILSSLLLISSRKNCEQVLVHDNIRVVTLNHKSFPTHLPNL